MGGVSMETYKLSDLCEILDAKRKPLSALQRAKKQGIYPYYGAQGIIDHLDEYLLDGEYLLVAEDGANLETRNQPIANIAKGKIWVNNHAHVLGSNGKCPLNLLGFILNNMNISPYVTGCAQPKLNQENLRNIEIELPSHIDSIASILSSLDRKIELNNKINADLEEMAQAIFKNWFVDFEPFKDGKFVDSELGMIPEGWKVGSLGDFCNVFTGRKNTNQAIEKGLYPFFSCAPEPLASNEAIFNGKAIIIAGNGSYTGRTSFYNGGFDLYQRTYACTIRERDKENLMIFFYHMMKQFFEPVKMGGTRGSSIPYIVMGDITQQKFPYSEDWLLRFSNIANSMMDKKLRIDKENSRLSLLRDTLLPRLMSGELEIPE